MTISHDHPVRTRSAAVYLRCYPYDHWNMDAHRWALEDYAHRLALGVPELYLDNGASSNELRPRLRLLLARASKGQVGTVLVPGPWVFSLDRTTAGAVVQFLHAAGTQVVELPGRGPRAGALR
ncbi:hypothetical protein [Kitasatospora sp. NPDC001527]|uniref:hypothetical protein n=1 Tax=Kitasatospora sp. NPDC001527 TaxID=3154519 RepID=UPI00332DA846